MWLVEGLYKLCMLVDGLVYDLLSKVYRLFTLVCQLNFSTLESIISPITDRIKAVILVVIFLKGGMLLIKLMTKPEDIQKSGGSLLKNIFIVAAMLAICNTVFGVLNEISLLIVGAPDGYSFPILSKIGVGGSDHGLINRFVFGEDKDVNDIGDYIAFETLSMFIRDASNEQESTTLENEIKSGNSYDFNKTHNLSPKVGKNIVYNWGISFLIAIYLIYCIGEVCIEIAIRMFKLLVLQIIAPAAIISKLDDKSKVFDQFVKAYISTYTSAFFRMASILIINVIISKVITNLGSVFGDVTSTSDGVFTKMLLTLIVVVAGYSFVKKLPDFIKEVTGLDISGGPKSFGSVVSGALGFGVGAASGLATGISSKAGVAGTIANMGLGAWNGGAAGLKGQTIKERVAGIAKSGQANGVRAADFSRRGFGNIVGGAVENFVGVGASQDTEMQRYNDATAALKAYETAQVEAIKDSKSSGITGFGAGVTSISFGDDKDSYANKALEYHTSYNNAKAALKVAESATYANDNDKMVAISKAQDDLISARDAAISSAKDEYDRVRNSASNDNISVKKSAAESAMRKAHVDVSLTSEGSINVKESNKTLTSKKHDLENKASYGRTHNGEKKK